MLFAAVNNLSDASLVAPYKLMGLAALSVDKAITLDHGPAMTLKAKLMYEGQLYEKDLKKTISLLEQAQKKDHPEAFAILRRIKKELKGEADYSKKNAP